MIKVLVKLNNVLTKCLSSTIDDCKELRRQLKRTDREKAEIVKQFKNIVHQNYLSLEDKVDKINDLADFYLDMYKKEELDFPETKI